MMQSFVDARGTEWKLEIDYSTTKLIKKRTEAGYDVKNFLKENGIAQLIADPFLIAEIIVILCENQFEKNGIDQDQFEQRLTGEVITVAADALIEAIIDFFPKSQQEPLRNLLAMVNLKTLKSQELLLEQMNSPAFDQKLQKIVAESMKSL